MSDPQNPESSPSTPAAPTNEVLAPDGVRPAGEPQEGGAIERNGSEDGDRGGIESPAKIIRIGAMIKQMLEEVRNTSIDDAARDQLRRIHDNSIEELKEAMSSDLGEELDSLTFEFNGEEPPSEAELRMAQAQLVGWLEGLFHGIQATLVAQQMAARQQIEGMRGQLPEPPGPPRPGPGYI